MRELNTFTRAAGAAILCLMVSGAMAQNDQTDGGQPGQPPQRSPRQRGNFDPAQFRQAMIDRYRERLEVKDDAEWKVIQPLIQNVLEARSAIGARARSASGRGGRPGGEQNSTAAVQRRSPTPENPAAEELQKAIDAKAPTPEMKAALAKYLEYRKAKQGELDKARDALRAVLTSRQEAIATLSGLL